MRSVDANLLSLDERERAARLGTKLCERVEREDEIWGLVKAAADPAYVARRVKLSEVEGGILVDGVLFRSEGLRLALSGCREGYILVSTLGYSIDRYLIQSAHEPYRLFVSDALADCLVESLSDYAMDELRGKELFTNRFSPGYADLPLEYGRVLVRMSGADKELGIRFTESGLMTPKKSVNAIFGIKDREV